MTFTNVSSDLAEQLSGKVGSAADLRHEVERLDHDFDFDSFASMSCVHGWAAHDREDADGTMYFESRQLDGGSGPRI